jgi:hypothetical protein
VSFLSVVRAFLFSLISLADLGESGDGAGRSVDPVLRFPFFPAFLPSPLLYPSFYATLASPRPRRVFSFCLFTCDISHLRVVPACHVLGYA